jgi:hypothetical protein
MILSHPVPSLLKQVNAGLGQRFGENPALYAQLGLIGHDGLDFPAALNTPVYAAHDGYLIYCNDDHPKTGLGIRQAFVEDGVGYELSYWHFADTVFSDMDYDLSNTSVFIKRGQLIGYVDTTGFSTGNHLHFGLRLFDPTIKEIINYGNGYKGAIDPTRFLQLPSNMIIIKDERTTPPTIIIGNKVDQPENLKWMCKENGVLLPLLNGGKDIDWDHVPYSGVIPK